MTKHARTAATVALDAVVEALQALRGVAQLTAIITVAEIGDIARFSSARQLMSCLGLTPSEYSTGKRRRLGEITKAGNSHVRRVLVESGWAYAHPARVTPILQKRLEKPPKRIREISWKADGPGPIRLVAHAETR